MPAEFVADERIREAMFPLGGGVFRLDGAPPGRFPFSSIKRRDGSAIQTGDQLVASFIQTGGVAICAGATYTSGGANTLTILADKVFKTSHADGVSIPGFDTGSPGECFLTTAADLLAQFTLAGELLNPDKFRKTVLKLVSAFDDEIGIVNGEGILAAAGATLPAGGGNFGDGLGGFFMMLKAFTEAADGVDRFGDPSGVGTIFRLPVKVSPTRRNNLIVSGNTFEVHDAADTKGHWQVRGWLEAAPENNCRIDIYGHAADPRTSGRIENGVLAFDLLGTKLRIRNDSGADVVLSYTKERIG